MCVLNDPNTNESLCALVCSGYFTGECPYKADCIQIHPKNGLNEITPLGSPVFGVCAWHNKSMSVLE